MRTATRPSALTQRHLVRGRTRPGTEAGVSLIGLLLTLAIIGALAAAIPILTDGSGDNPGLPTSTLRATGQPAAGQPDSGQPGGGNVSAVGSDLTAAETAACKANYEAAETAASAYEDETGSRPTSISQVQALIRDPLSSAFFTITIDRRQPGELQVATPGHPAADGDANCAAGGG